MAQITASLENYLETILQIQLQNNSVKAIEVSKRLNVSKASVTEALRALKVKALINYLPYGDISLTPHGEEIARKIAAKHEVLNNFFIDVLGLDANTASQDACKIEHVISDTAFDRIMKFLEFTDINSTKQGSFIKDFHNFRKNKNNG